MKYGKLLTKGKSLMLAYDHGLEHGPSDFNDKTVDPSYIMDIANKGKYNAIIFQKGIAEKYYQGKTPLVIKLNGKTKYLKGEPVSRQLCSVKEAISLGAKAVGYTIYVGSKHEQTMFQEFENIQREAHKHNIPVIAWMYPRGKAIKNELSKDTLAYAARIGLELGADMIKIKYNGKAKDLQWVAKNAGKAKVLIAGGSKTTPYQFLKEAHDVVNNGAIGLAVGRNVWQSKDPITITKALKQVVFQGVSPKEALKK